MEQFAQCIAFLVDDAAKQFSTGSGRSGDRQVAVPYPENEASRRGAFLQGDGAEFKVGKGTCLHACKDNALA